MKLTILYDNESSREGLKSGWGFSCLIEVDGKNILFDVGWDGGMLLDNMHALGVNPQEIDVIVLSHQHWDHTGGLNHVLAEVGDAEVYVPESFSSHMKNEIKKNAALHEVSNARKIFDGVWTTGELMTTYSGARLGEQSLVIENKKGLTVVVGCSHPGLEEILEIASGFGSLYGVIGGFHGFNKYNALKDLELIVPTHCTVHKEEIRGEYGSKVESGGAGWSVEL